MGLVPAALLQNLEQFLPGAPGEAGSGCRSIVVAVFQAVPTLGHAAFSGPDLGRKIFELNLVSFTGDEGVFDGILQLTHVTGPAVVHEGVIDLIRDRFNLLAGRTPEPLEERPFKNGYVFLALHECRHTDVKDLNAVVEVLAKLALVDQVPQIAMGRRNHAHVRLARPDLPHPLEGTFLDDAQQFELNQRTDITNLIEEQGPTIRRFKTTDLVTDRSCECPPDVPKQFTLQQALGQGRADDLDKRLIVAGAVAVDRIGSQFFARTRVAVNEDRGIRLRSQTNPLVDLPHDMTVPHQSAHARCTGDRTAPGLQFLFQLFAVAQVCHGFDDAEDAPFVVAHDPGILQHGDHLTRLATDAAFHVFDKRVARLSSGTVPDVVLPVGAAAGAFHALQKRAWFSENFVRTVAGELLHGGIPQPYAAVGIKRHQAVGHHIEHIFQLGTPNVGIGVSHKNAPEFAMQRCTVAYATVPATAKENGPTAFPPLARSLHIVSAPAIQQRRGRGPSRCRPTRGWPFPSRRYCDGQG